MTAPPTITLTVNGRTLECRRVPDDERLLDTLRWRLGLKGTKEGCRTGDCGACTVLVDGESVLSCLALTHTVEGSSLVTVEGIAAEPLGKAVVAAFQAEGAVQCGYCTPGFVVALTGLLKERGPKASREEILAALSGNLCRCTGYSPIIRATERLLEKHR
ncbi:MAG: (2Fe-2S)-binding protein [Thermoplasmata archaeon]|nr:(2Fe-2S)-binding protein [Thermoplasmata archaeon]